MARYDRTVQPRGTTIEDPPISRALFNDVRLSWLWLVVRVYLGWQWLEAGWTKLQSPEWMKTGAALRGFLEHALAPDPNPVVGYDWYRRLLEWLVESESYVWFAKVIAVGETLVGIALILGFLIGISAFAGSLLSFNFMLAGGASTNPVLFTLAIALMLAWKTAGWIGLDRWLLPLLGTPWNTGLLFRRREVAARPRLSKEGARAK